MADAAPESIVSERARPPPREVLRATAGHDRRPGVEHHDVAGRTCSSPSSTARTTAAFSSGEPPAIDSIGASAIPRSAGVTNHSSVRAVSHLDHPCAAPIEISSSPSSAQTTSARSQPSATSASAIVSW